MKDYKKPEQIERRDFLKKTGAAPACSPPGFPAIISGQTVTNALKVGLVGCGGRGSGAAGQALTADPNNELTAIADIDEAIVDAGQRPAEGQREVRSRGQDRDRALRRARRLREGDQQRRRRRAARDAAGLPSAAPDGRGERQQARVLREAVRDRFARRAQVHGGAEARPDEEPLARRRASAGATTT